MGISKIKPLTSQYHSVGGSRGRGLLCLAPQLVCFFVSLFLCQQNYEKTAEPICVKFSGKVWSDHGTTWLNFGSIRVNGSKVNLFVITGHSSGLALTSRYHSLGGGRGPSLLCLAPQLVTTWLERYAHFTIPHRRRIRQPRWLVTQYTTMVYLPAESPITVLTGTCIKWLLLVSRLSKLKSRFSS